MAIFGIDVRIYLGLLAGVALFIYLRRDNQREWMNNNPMIVYGGGGVLVFIGIVGIMMQFAGKNPADTPKPGQSIFLDPISQKQVRFPTNALSPQVVDDVAYYKVQLYSCGDCNDDSKKFIGYMTMYTPKIRKLLEEEPDHEDRELFEVDGKRYAQPEVDGIKGKVMWTDDVGVMLRIINKKCKKKEKARPCSVKYKAAE